MMDSVEFDGGHYLLQFPNVAGIFKKLVKSKP